MAVAVETSLESEIAQLLAGPEYIEPWDVATDFLRATDEKVHKLAEELGWEPHGRDSAAAFLRNLKTGELFNAIRVASEIFKPVDASAYQFDIDELAKIGLIGGLSSLYLDSSSKLWDQLKALSRNNELAQRAKQGIAVVKEQRKEVKPLTVASNHAFRNAILKYGLDWRNAHRCLFGAQLGDAEKASDLLFGLGVEIAAYKHLYRLIKESGVGHLRFGDISEDLKSGDLVYEVNGKTVFFDAKAGPPKKHRTYGHEEFTGINSSIMVARNEGEKRELGCDVSVTFWPNEPQMAVTDLFFAGGGFKLRLTDILHQVHQRLT